MRRRLLACVALLALACGPASAHVDVLPRSVVTGTPQEFTIRVPSEGTSPTTSLTVRLPTQIAGQAIAEPPPGWRARDIIASGALAGVELTGGQIAPGRYLDFHLIGNPVREGQALWRVVQRFADGTSTQWTAAPTQGTDEPGPGAAGPAAVVTVTAQAVEAASSSGGDGDSSTAGTWLGVIAIAIAALAAIATGLLWSSRPMRLPEDE